ncbi:MAG: cell wall hydrolase [Ramlibacter sp.]
MPVRVWNATIDPGAECAGTLTCVARVAGDPTRVVAMTAAHVLAPFVAEDGKGARVGDEVHFDTGGAQPVIGALWFWMELQRIVDGFSNDVDAALVQINASDAGLLLRHVHQPATIGSPEPGPIRFDGASSSASGTFDDARTSDPIPYPVRGGSVASVAFSNSFRARLPVRPGDSGSLLTDSNHAVGMLIASEGDACRFLPLRHVLETLNLEWISEVDAPGATEPTALEPALLPDHHDAIDTLARTLWGEARGEKLAGIRSVAAVVVNRATHPRIHWWGTTIVGVCRAEKQFSCWNPNDANLPKLLAVTEADDRFRVCLEVARDAVEGRLDLERRLGATHYHTKAIRPKWARHKIPCADIGNHLFYNDID